VLWTGTCASFVLAGSALAADGDGWRDFGLRVAPKLDRLNFVAAAILLATGVANLAIVGASRDYDFSRTFLAVLGLKSGLFVAMALMLAATWRAERSIPSRGANGIRRMLRLSGLTVAAGSLALALGIWLVGS
jgi:hypothetical protein